MENNIKNMNASDPNPLMVEMTTDGMCMVYTMWNVEQMFEDLFRFPDSYQMQARTGVTLMRIMDAISGQCHLENAMRMNHNNESDSATIMGAMNLRSAIRILFDQDQEVLRRAMAWVWISKMLNGVMANDSVQTLLTMMKQINAIGKARIAVVCPSTK